MSLASACRRVIDMYDVDNWWPARTRFEVMVGAILVQNTRWSNAALAVRELRRRRQLSASAIVAADARDLTAVLRPAGCQSVKARRLKSLAEWVDFSGGIRRLAQRPTSWLRDELLTLHGVGPETADAILCFAFGRSVFVADKYSRTWLARMDIGTTRETSSYAACREFVERGLCNRAIDLGDLHAAIVLHGQTRCKARPACTNCGFRSKCRHAGERLQVAAN